MGFGLSKSVIPENHRVARIRLTSCGVVAKAFENADDRVAAPNRDPVGSNLLRRDLRLWLVATRQALALLHPRRPMDNLR
jgi:hypothetical protein